MKMNQRSLGIYLLCRVGSRREFVSDESAEDMAVGRGEGNLVPTGF